MKVSPRLLPPAQYSNSEFVEVRYFRLGQSSLNSAVLFGFLERLMLSHCKYERDSLKYDIDYYNQTSARYTSKDNQKLLVIPYLLSSEFAFEDKFAAWNCDDLCFSIAKLEFEAVMRLNKCEDAAFLEEFIRKFKLQLINVSAGTAIDTQKTQIYWDNIEGQICLFYKSYAFDSFMTTECEHIQLRNIVFRKAANVIGSQALNEEEFLSVHIPCRENCTRNIAKEAFQIAAKAGTPIKQRGKDILNFLLSGRQHELEPKWISSYKCAFCGVNDSQFSSKFFSCNCSICEMCALVSFYTELHGNCPICDRSMKWETAKANFQKALTIECGQINLLLQCKQCTKLKAQTEFSIVLQLQDKCALCDPCWLRKIPYRNSECPSCRERYSSEDIEISTKIRKSASNEFPDRNPQSLPRRKRSNAEGVIYYQNCEVCKIMREKSDFAPLDHCQVCDECYFKNFIGTHADECPKCKRLLEESEKARLEQHILQLAERVNLMIKCDKCLTRKDKTEFGKSKIMEHWGICTVCDQCLVALFRGNSQRANCPRCSRPLSEFDSRYASIFQAGNPPDSHSEERTACKCGRAITASKYLCDNKCLCSLCMVRSFILTKEKKCQQCQKQQEIGLYLSYMKCSACLRSIYVEESFENSKISGICEKNCLLCCYCIDFTSGYPHCAVCNSPVELTRELRKVGFYEFKMIFPLIVDRITQLRLH